MEHDEVNAELEELLEGELPWTHYDHVQNEKKSGNIPPLCRVGRAAASPESKKLEQRATEPQAL